MAAKRNLPAHGYLGFYYGSSKKEVTEIIRKKYKIPAKAKIVVNPAYDKGIYECEVIPPAKEKRS